MNCALTPEDRRKLELAGLIRPAEPAQVNKGGRPPAPKPPKVTHIIAPVAKGTRAKRKWSITVQECRDQNICQYCRKEPARYFGPDIGYSAGCPRCTVANSAAARRAKQ